ncbi:hypothetical protein IE53DRAFT_225896 [Violaceomyces palustris]|uniref:Uncharacterized protein n=1 Tax=Violaceomyces palustris TaxID=1673888 RepID=A0ACD0NPZ9_9BASI|nr:hypothetical protein IE53DRAFT_225896 [Violaceomyces palustris]
MSRIEHIPPVSLDSFLGSLLGKDEAQLCIDELQLDESLHANPLCKTAFINFTHMVPLTQSQDNCGTIAQAFLWNCWQRGVAIQCPANQQGIDGLIPVFVGDLDAPVSGSKVPGYMTYVAWQAKMRTRG